VVIGSKNVLVSLREISETLPVSEIQPVPIVKPWFLGVSNVRGVLYAINDVAQLLEATFTSISSNARLLLISDTVSSNVAFVVEKMIGLRNINEMKPHEIEHEESACLKTQTYQDDENRIWHMMDCDKLVRSKEFATPYIT
ncbi:MAG TPA: chemotaxis protein CheW, partial [Methylotenera sp.]|nr:chemotaxis protein CheW [Methylotenera sp.]